MPATAAAEARAWPNHHRHDDVCQIRGCGHGHRHGDGDGDGDVDGDVDNHKNEQHRGHSTALLPANGTSVDSQGHTVPLAGRPCSATTVHLGVAGAVDTRAITGAFSVRVGAGTARRCGGAGARWVARRRVSGQTQGMWPNLTVSWSDQVVTLRVHKPGPALLLV